MRFGFSTYLQIEHSTSPPLVTLPLHIGSRFLDLDGFDAVHLLLVKEGGCAAGGGAALGGFGGEFRHYEQARMQDLGERMRDKIGDRQALDTFSKAAGAVCDVRRELGRLWLPASATLEDLLAAFDELFRFQLVFTPCVSRLSYPYVR